MLQEFFILRSCNRGSKNYQAVLRSIRYVTETEKDLKEPSYNYKSSAELPSLVSDLYNGKKVNKLKVDKLIQFLIVFFRNYYSYSMYI